MSNLILSRCLVACACALPALPSLAATNVACVGSSNELTAALAALSTSSANSDADEIRIRVGTYPAPGSGFFGSVTTHHNLTIRGGYLDAACSQQTLDASRTTLDGNHASTVLTIDTPLIPNSDIAVEGLTFQNGSGLVPFNSSAGALKIGDPNPISGGNVLVERNIFRNNTGNAGGSLAVGALLAATDGTALIVRGNLFVGNQSPNASAVYLYSNNAIDFSNNTLVNNLALDTMQSPRAAIGFFTFGGLKSTNNIFWANGSGAGAFDINFADSHVTSVNDDIEAFSGTATSMVGALHIDPGFAASNDFRLAVDSPLIDAGAVGVPEGGLSAADLDGATRIAGNGIDLGAYESNFIFVDSFE